MGATTVYKCTEMSVVDGRCIPLEPVPVRMGIQGMLVKFREMGRL